MRRFTPIVLGDQLVLGNLQSPVGVVTCWTDVARVRDSIDDPELYAAIGNLYSAASGIDPLIRNLLANPGIRTLILTPPDLSGSGQALESFFYLGVEEGVTEIGLETWKIRGDLSHPGYIGRDIPLEALDLLRRNVQIVKVGNINDVRPLAAEHSRNGHTPYGEPQIFPPPPVTEIEYWPGNSFGHTVIGERLADVWVLLLSAIRNHGNVNGTHYGEPQREIVGLRTTITGENPSDIWVPNFLPCDKAYLETYTQQILTGRAFKGTKYTYGQRMREYFDADQFVQVVDRLVAELDARSAVISLWDPKVDGMAVKGTPCLNHLWFRIVDGKLHLIVTIRSNDMYKAWPENAYSYLKLQAEMARWVGERISREIGIGPLQIHSLSAHIYQRDWDNASRVIEQHLPRIIRARMAKPRDPFGTFRITVEGDTIRIQLLSPSTGEFIRLFEGKTVREIIVWLETYGCVSSISHAAYLGRELEKAETALKLSLPYTQGKPLAIAKKS